jgi:hypothetical protein
MTKGIWVNVLNMWLSQTADWTDEKKYSLEYGQRLLCKQALGASVPPGFMDF